MLGNGSSIILLAQKAFPVIGVVEATAMEILKNHNQFTKL
jgi:hypothetical protein